MKVLILDDEAEMGEILAHLLRRSGFDVQLHHAISSAKAALTSFNPDAIVCDMNMPEMTGVEFFKRHCQEWRGHFLILTGDITVPVEEIYTIGIKHVLFKPKDLTRIIPLLNELALQPR